MHCLSISHSVQHQPAAQGKFNIGQRPIYQERLSTYERNARSLVGRAA